MYFFNVLQADPLSEVHLHLLASFFISVPGREREGMIVRESKRARESESKRAREQERKREREKERKREREKERKREREKERKTESGRVRE